MKKEYKAVRLTVKEKGNNEEVRLRAESKEVRVKVVLFQHLPIYLTAYLTSAKYTKPVLRPLGLFKFGMGNFAISLLTCTIYLAIMTQFNYSEGEKSCLSADKLFERPT